MKDGDFIERIATLIVEHRAASLRSAMGAIWRITTNPKTQPRGDSGENRDLVAARGLMEGWRRMGFVARVDMAPVAIHPTRAKRTHDVVAAFRQEFALFALSQFATLACNIATNAFLEFALTRHGVAGRKCNLFFEKNPYYPIPPEKRTTPGHAVAKVGTYFIDWTARQYDANAPFPLVWR